jgi:hypothetical protein
VETKKRGTGLPGTAFLALLRRNALASNTLDSFPGWPEVADLDRKLHLLDEGADFPTIVVPQDDVHESEGVRRQSDDGNLLRSASGEEIVGEESLARGEKG